MSVYREEEQKLAAYRHPAMSYGSQSPTNACLMTRYIHPLSLSLPLHYPSLLSLFLLLSLLLSLSPFPHTSLSLALFLSPNGPVHRHSSSQTPCSLFSSTGRQPDTSPSPSQRKCAALGLDSCHTPLVVPAQPGSLVEDVKACRVYCKCQTWMKFSTDFKYYNSNSIL